MTNRQGAVKARVGRAGASGLLAAALALGVGTAWAQGAPAGGAAPAEAGADDDGEGELVVLRAARVITVDGAEHAPGVVVLRGRRIEAVGPKVAAPAGARVVDLGDRVVMPGLVVARTRLGLRGYERSGNRADLSAEAELLAAPGRFAAARRAGVTLLGVIPAGGGIPGQVVAARPLDGPAAEVLVPGCDLLRVRFASLPGDKATLRDALRGARQAIEREDKARAEHEAKQKQLAAEAEKAKAAGSTAPVASPQAFAPPQVPPPLRPFVALRRKAPGAPRLLVEVSSASDVVHFDDAREDLDLAPVWFASNGVQGDLERAVERLAKGEATVVCYPRLSYEVATRTRRNVPAELARAGARVAFVPQGEDAAGLARLLEAAALLVREGLPRDVALAALTRNGARALGVEGETGALVAGRRADLLVLRGDPLEPGAEVEQVWIEGRQVWPEEDRP